MCSGGGSACAICSRTVSDTEGAAGAGQSHSRRDRLTNLARHTGRGVTGRRRRKGCRKVSWSAGTGLCAVSGLSQEPGSRVIFIPSGFHSGRGRSLSRPGSMPGSSTGLSSWGAMAPWARPRRPRSGANQELHHEVPPARRDSVVEHDGRRAGMPVGTDCRATQSATVPTGEDQAGSPRMRFR